MSTPPVAMPDLCSRRRPYHYITALNLLLRLGIDIHRVNILAVCKYQNYRGEVHGQSPDPGTPLDTRTSIDLQVGYDSAVDIMPYQFFYGLAGITARSDGWDRQARRMLAPFDGSVVRYQALATNQALRFSLSQNDRDHLTRYLSLFGFALPDDQAGLRELRVWAALMPTFHHWAGNAEFVAKVLTAIFGYRFRILENIPSEQVIPDSLQSRLGTKSYSLGRTMVLGRTFTECDSACEVRISGVPEGDAAQWLTGQPKHRKLLWILNTTLPNNLDCRIRVDVTRAGMNLGTATTRSRLGYSSYV